MSAENCVICGLSLDDHWLASCPDVAGDPAIERTWDGEPLYSPATVQEGLFAGDAFQQMPGQLPIEEPELPKFRRNDSLVFKLIGEQQERSGQFWSDEQGCGVTVYGWADGRMYLVGHQDIRAETDVERYQREHNGYYAEQLS